VQCPNCKREMKMLFVSQACDHCDFGVDVSKLHRGYVMWSEGEQAARFACEEYVFNTPQHAEKWRERCGRSNYQIRAVYSLDEFRWSTGTEGIQYCTIPYLIFPDHKYEPLPGRAFLGAVQNVITPDQSEDNSAVPG